jgi:hypothetical protein
MDTILSLRQLSEVIERNPTALAVVANMPRIEIDDVAYAVSRMAIDVNVARDLVATSSGRRGCSGRLANVYPSRDSRRPSDRSAWATEHCGRPHRRGGPRVR